MIWGIVYGVGALVAGAVAYRKIVWSMYDDFRGHVDGEDYLMALIPASCMALAWPVLLVVAPVYMWVRRDVERNHPKAVRRREMERERELRARELEIVRMERELGISGDIEPSHSMGPLTQRAFARWRGRR